MPMAKINYLTLINPTLTLIAINLITTKTQKLIEKMPNI